MRASRISIVLLAWAWLVGAALVVAYDQHPITLWLRVWVLAAWIFVSFASWPMIRKPADGIGMFLFAVVFTPAAVCVASIGALWSTARARASG